MGKRGGIKRTTWPKGKRPPVQKPKGSKHRKTILKEAMGLKHWEGLKEFVEKDGASKLVLEIKKLRGKNFVQAYGAIAEFVKPKLSRISGDPENPFALNITKELDMKKLTEDELRQIITITNKAVKS